MHACITLACGPAGVEQPDLMYLDATFGDEPQDFPSREQSLEMLSSLLLRGGYERAYVCGECGGRGRY